MARAHPNWSPSWLDRWVSKRLFLARPQLIQAVVVVELDSRTAKATVGGRHTGPIDFAALAQACFEAIAMADELESIRSRESVAGTHKEHTVSHAPTVIISAPPGAGKTRNAEQLREIFGCTQIIDGWDGLRPPNGALVLTSAPVEFVKPRDLAYRRETAAREELSREILAFASKIMDRRPELTPAEAVLQARDALLAALRAPVTLSA